MKRNSYQAVPISAYASDLLSSFKSYFDGFLYVLNIVIKRSLFMKGFPPMNYRNLDVWKISVSLALSTFKTLKILPKHELYGIAD